MTNMTSSTANNQPPSLTDFSIHSIIHGRSPAQSNRLPTNDYNPATLNAQLPATGDAIQQLHRRQPTAGVRKYRPKNFQCPACNMAFSNNGQLKNHVRIHTGERPFQCDLANCRKTFTRNEELTRHKLIHTGFRPHACSTCNKSFGRKDHLKKHLRTHERKKLRRRVSLVTGQHQVVSADSNIQQQAACYLANQPTSTTNNYQQPNVRSLSCVSVCSPQDISLFHPAAIMSTHQSASLLTHHLPTTTTASLSIQSPPKSSLEYKPLLMSSNTIQQLASDYWTKWYNILGLYHHQPVVSSALPIAPLPESPNDPLFSKHF